jgi:hypothetical protein
MRITPALIDGRITSPHPLLTIVESRGRLLPATGPPVALRVGWVHAVVPAGRWEHRTGRVDGQGRHKNAEPMLLAPQSVPVGLKIMPLPTSWRSSTAL